MWSGRLPQANKITLRESLVEYLKIIIAEGWEKTEKGEISEELEKAVIKMNDAVTELCEAHPSSSSRTFLLFANVVSYREKRLHHGSEHMPRILRNILRFATSLMICLCPLIVVKDFELHYIFSVSIAVLSYSIYLVATDLDSPLRPGGWHLTTIDYQLLLARLEKAERVSAPIVLENLVES